jgi:thiol-disulfide isomerase/thioredoxin
MKSLLIIAALFLRVYGFSQIERKAFSVVGNVSSIKEKVTKVYYRYQVDGNYKQDSAIVKDDKYTLTGIASDYVLLQTMAAYGDTSLKQDYKRDYLVVHILPGTNASVKHHETFASANIHGSLAQDEYNQLHPRLVKGDIAFLPGYIKDHPNSPLAVFLLNQFIIGPFLDVNKHEPLYNLLSNQNKNTPAGKELAQRIEYARITAIGKKAPDVQQRDSAGNVIALSDFKGKHVLLNFWASWCLPCRKENPMLIDLYHKYKAKGFEIFGISVDDKRNNWINALLKDRLTWINTADLVPLNKNKATITYGITGIPVNYLVDANGNILAKNIGPEKLEQTLASIFKE